MPRKKKKKCKDCLAEGITTHREAKYPGPRCHTHYQALKKRRRDYNHSEHIGKTYGITAEEYKDCLLYTSDAADE